MRGQRRQTSKQGPALTQDFGSSVDLTPERQYILNDKAMAPEVLRRSRETLRGALPKLRIPSIPLIPNALKRTKTAPSKSAEKTPISPDATQHSYANVSSAMAQIQTKNTASSGYDPRSTHSNTLIYPSNTPLSPAEEWSSSWDDCNHSGAETGITTPGSDPSRNEMFPTGKFPIRPGVLPDASPSTVGPSGSSRAARGPLKVANGSVKSPTSAGSDLLQVDSNLSSPVFRFSAGTEQSFAKGAAETGTAATSLQRPAQNTIAEAQRWGPHHPGHDKWRDMTYKEKQEQRNLLYSGISAFNWGNVREGPPPERPVGPAGELATPLVDAGGLLEERIDYFVRESERSRGPSAAVPPVAEPSEGPFSPFPDMVDGLILPGAGTSIAGAPRTLLNASSGDAEGQPSSGITVLPQSLDPRMTAALPSFDAAEPIAEETSGSESDSESGAAGPEHSDADSSDDDISPLALGCDSTRPSIPKYPNGPAICRSSFQRTPFYRSRGESIGLPSCSEHPHVKAADMEKMVKSKPRMSGGRELTVGIASPERGGPVPTKMAENDYMPAEGSVGRMQLERFCTSAYPKGGRGFRRVMIAGSQGDLEIERRRYMRIKKCEGRAERRARGETV